MRLFIFIFGFFVAVTAPGAVSRARADGSVLVLGEVSPQQRELITVAVVTTARDGGWSLTARTFTDPENDVVTACLRAAKPWSCVAPQMQDRGDQLVVVQVEVEQTDTVLSVHVVTAASDADSTANHFCNACDDGSLKLAVSDVTRRLLRDAAERSGTTRLAIASNPAGAWITLDGKPAGSTNTIRSTYPGEHTVMVTLAGYATATHTVRVKEGELLPLAVRLEPALSTVIDGSGDPRARSARRVPLLLFGASAVAFAGGAVLLWADEDPSPIGPQSPRYYNTAPHGVGAFIVGVAALGAGAYLWLRPSWASRSKSTPTLAPSASGAAVGWSGRF